MNRSIVMMISPAVMDRAFFACSTVMPKITYHGPRFEE